MNVIENSLNPIIEPWSEPGEFSRTKHSVVYIDGVLRVAVKSTDLLEWKAGSGAMDGSLSRSFFSRNLLEEYINAGADALKPYWPPFVTDIGSWAVRNAEVTKTGWIVDVFPVDFESAQDIIEEGQYE